MSNTTRVVQPQLHRSDSFGHLDTNTVRTRSMPSTWPLSLSGALLLIPLVSTAWAAGTEVHGDYRYAFRKPQTDASAQTYACEQAARAAVSRSEVFREATAHLVDSPLLRTLVDTVRKDALTDVQIVEQHIEGSVASCQVTGRLDPSAVVSLTKAQVVGPVDTAKPSMDQNRALRLLSVTDDTAGFLLIAYEALRRLDWLSTAYQGSLRDESDIRVEFFDARGQSLGAKRLPARLTSGGDDVMNPGEIGTRQVLKPAGTQSWRVWLSK
ncbi:MAG: hypothetical protein U0172_05885 [Nitrospiraceae bacterium]